MAIDTAWQSKLDAWVAGAPDADGVVAETTLRAELWPRLLAATEALFTAYPPSYPSTAADRARRDRVLAVCAALDAGDAAAAVAGLAGLEALAGVRA